VSVSDVAEFETGLLEWFRTRHAGLLEGIRADGDIGDVDAFEAAIKAFAAQFTGSTEAAAAPGIDDPGDADTSVKRAPAHLPETEVERSEG
jgi:hypothetical protein